MKVIIEGKPKEITAFLKSIGESTVNVKLDAEDLSNQLVNNYVSLYLSKIKSVKRWLKKRFKLFEKLHCKAGRNF